MKMTPVLFVIALVVAINPAGATQTSGTNDDAVLYDPLQDSHLIIRGTVLRVWGERTTLGDFGAVPKRDRAATWPMNIAHIQFAVSEVIKGAWLDNEIEFTLRGEGGLFRPGAEMIVCARRWTHEGRELYAVGEHLGIFEQQMKDTWVSVTTEHSTRAQETLGYHALIARVREASLPNVTAAADVVARGIIVGMRTAEYSAEDGRVGLMVWYSLRVIELLKGRASDVIDFVVPRIDAPYVPSWTRLTPVGIEEGQEWYVFLRNGEIGPYPFAGPNSLLLVDGEKLIYDMSVEYPVTAKDLNRIVRLEARNEN